MMLKSRRVAKIGMSLTAAALVLSGCEWQGVNSLPIPGTEGNGPGSYTVDIEMPNVTSLQRNSRVRVADVDVGHVTDIRLQDWHALVTVQLDGGVTLPKNTVAKVGQTSLLGTLHVELAPPLDEPAEGRLADEDTIPIAHAGLYPTTEQTLASVSTLLNGGGLAQLNQIDTQLNAALAGHETDVRSLITQLDTFTSALNEQKDDIITASEGLDRLAGTVNAQTPVLERALDSIPPALAVLNEQKDNLSNAIVSVGNFAEVANRGVTESHDDLVRNLRALEPTLRGLADAGPALTQALGYLPTFPWPLDGTPNFVKGDYANLSPVIDLTLGRLDNSVLQGTPAEGSLIALETAMGRTLGRQPNVATTANPLTAPMAGSGN
ncbi:MCE family protein [Rhodococcus sp. NM-2]|uniref:MCE family protein n=1 Tax=Rhodococcus sp. NM-2 TaxID=3401174 RepID=UPI003AADB99C